MKLQCIGEYIGFTVGEEYQAHTGSDPVFGYDCYIVIDDDDEMRSIDLETEDFIDIRYK